ncbi:hypothetical protein, partial [Dysgonomonas sp. HGC4]
MKGASRLRLLNKQYRGFLFFVFIVFLSSCQEDEGYQHTVYKKVSLSVSMPQTYATSLASVWESSIHTVDVLVFESSTDN